MATSNSRSSSLLSAPLSSSVRRNGTSPAKPKSSKRKLTKCDIRLICALLEGEDNQPKLDAVDGRTKVGIRSVLQTKKCKELADFIKKKQLNNNVTKKPRSPKAKKKTRKLTSDDIHLVCTWLEDEGNRSKVHGVDGRTKVGIKPVDRAKVYRELADFINKNQAKDSTSSPITGDSMTTRFCLVMKRFRETRKLAESKDFGLTDEDRSMNISTIQDKLENLCPGFNRFEAMFGISPSVNPDVTKGAGVGIFGTAECIFPLDSIDSAAGREMDYKTEDNPVMIKTVDFDQDEDGAEKTAPPSAGKKTRRVEDEDRRLQLQHTEGEYQLEIHQIEDDRKERAMRTREDIEAEQAIVKMNLQIAMISSHRSLEELKEILKISEF